MRFKNQTLMLLLGAALAGCATAPPPPSVKASEPTPTVAPALAPAAVVPPAPPPTPAAVRNMINNCFSCHGTDGRSSGAMPSLAGLSAQQAALALKEFKSGARSATVMARHAKGYSDAELEALANYIGANLN